MDIIIISPILLYLIGIILDLLSLKRSDKLIRSIEICEDSIIELIKRQFKGITNHYKNEIDRILARAFNPASIEKIQVMNIKEKDLNIEKITLNSFQNTNRYIIKLKSAHLRIKTLRIVFAFIFCITLIVCFVFIKWPNILPNSIPMILLVISFIYIMFVIYDLVSTTNLIDIIRKEYGISI